MESYAALTTKDGALLVIIMVYCLPTYSEGVPRTACIIHNGGDGTKEQWGGVYLQSHVLNRGIRAERFINRTLSRAGGGAAVVNLIIGRVVCYRLIVLRLVVVVVVQRMR